MALLKLEAFCESWATFASAIPEGWWPQMIIVFS